MRLTLFCHWFSKPSLLRVLHSQLCYSISSFNDFLQTLPELLPVDQTTEKLVTMVIRKETGCAHAYFKKVIVPSSVTKLHQSCQTSVERPEAGNE